MSYILILAGWYPSRVDEFSGDFVQRHAASISLYNKVVVLFLVKDPKLPRGQVEIRRSGSGNLAEYIGYYSTGGTLERPRSLLRYIALGRKMIPEIVKEHGAPALLHVNVVWKAGLLALDLKKRYGWQFVVTEHWMGYTDLNPEGLKSQGRLMQWLYKKVYAGAELFLPVSAAIDGQVRQWFPCPPGEVVYNVVDTRLFHYQAAAGETEPPLWRLIHVSAMDYPKNIEGLLRVLHRLTTIREDVEIRLVGTFPPWVRQTLADSGLLDRKVFLTGAVPYAEVARLMQQSHLFVLFSRFENLPCVLLESLCCGVPVVATRVGGIPEIVSPSNGLLVEPGQEDLLLAAIQDILDHYSRYDRRAMAGTAQRKYSYPVIGEQFARIYRQLLYTHVPPNSGLPPSPE